MAISGWFITAMALAGLAGVSMNYFSPAAMIRFSAIVRTAGRYGDRVVSHEVTFRLLARLRSWFYHHLEPLAPAVLENYHRSDLLSRIRADIDNLDNFYLRLFQPLIVALLGTIIILSVVHAYSSATAWVLLLGLASTGLLLPWLSATMGKQHGAALNTSDDNISANINRKPCKVWGSWSLPVPSNNTSRN